MHRVGKCQSVSEKGQISYRDGLRAEAPSIGIDLIWPLPIIGHCSLFIDSREVHMDKTASSAIGRGHTALFGSYVGTNRS